MQNEESIMSLMGGSSEAKQNHIFRDARLKGDTQGEMMIQFRIRPTGGGAGGSALVKVSQGG